MASSHRKIENFLQPLGESYFTRNQALYSALLAIKNAFCLDKTQNLQKLRKRRNNRQKYFARMGNKARKILDVAQALPKQFSEASGIKLGKGMLPYVLSGLIVAAPFIGLFNGKANAAEGSSTKVTLKAPIPDENKSRFPTYEECRQAGIDRTGNPNAGVHVCAMDEARHYSMEHENGVGVYINYAANPELPPEEIEGTIADAFYANKMPNFKIASSHSEQGGATGMTFFVKGTPVAKVILGPEVFDELARASNMAKGVIKTSSNMQFDAK